MDNLKIATDILAVAREMMADEFPFRMSERGQRALTKLRESIANKHIWNQDYNDIRSTLSRDFEKASDVPGGTPLYSFFYYGSGFSHLGLNNVVSYARTVRKFSPEDVEAMKAKFPNAAEGLAKTFADFAGLKEQAERHLKNIESWAGILPMLKEVKQYIEKGRKPIERPPGYVPNIYVPPMPGAQAVSLVQGKLTEIVEAQRAALVEKITANTIKKLSEYNGDGTYKDIREYLKAVYMDGAMGYFKPIGAVDSFVLRDDYKDAARSGAEEAVQATIDMYVTKNIKKIAPIVHAKGEPNKVKVSWGNLAGWGFNGTIDFDFPDGTRFEVRNQAVIKGGFRNWFMQFPTTFHNVKFKSGTVRAMVPEKDMNEVWAKEA